MLTKQELEDLIKAWPDENGETSDPDTYFNWIEKQRRYFAGVVWCGMPLGVLKLRPCLKGKKTS